MGEFNGVVLSILLVVAIFAAMIPVMTNLYNGVISSVDEEVTGLLEDSKVKYTWDAETGKWVEVEVPNGQP